jgi:hypothetical protein
MRVIEYTVWGELVRSFGWKVNKTKVEAGAPEAEQNVCPIDPSDECQAGSDGSGANAGAGRFAVTGPQGIAIDSAGNVYVVDRLNRRVEKFDHEGHFLRMWGKGVNTGTGANKELCTNAGPPTDVCGAGEVGSGPGQFGAWIVVGSYIAIDTIGTESAADDKVYVGDVGRIQRFNSAGEFQAQITTGLAGKKVRSLAVVPKEGDLAMITESEGTEKSDPNIARLKSNGTLRCNAAAEEPTAVAVDAQGKLYAFDHNKQFEVESEEETYVREFERKECIEVGLPFGTEPILESTGLATGQACLSKGVDVYVSNASQASGFLRAYGPSPDKFTGKGEACQPPEAPPSIDAQYATSVGATSATLKAAINPHFWADTTYYMQYASAACIEAGGWEASCVNAKPAPLGTALGAGAVDRSVTISGVLLQGLSPDTEYRFRFAAQSSGGGPVFGLGGKPGEDGAEASFHTFAPPVAPTSPDPCANAAYRIGAGAFLADCRAYEMVSPIDKEGGDILPPFTLSNKPAQLLESALSGEKLTYSNFRAFGDAQSEPFSSQYLASREAGGWSSHAISPPRGIPVSKSAADANDTEFKAFSADLCNSWLVRNVTASPPLAPGAPEGFRDLYRRSNCGAEGYEALSTMVPPSLNSEAFVIELQGVSSDAGTAVFWANDAVGIGGTSAHEQLYATAGGGTEPRLVCVLPDGTTTATSCTAGSAGSPAHDTRSRSVAHALSNDGSRVYWSDLSTSLGKLFLRENPTQPQSALDGEGDCVEPAKACTIAVSTGKAQFWTAASDGSRALFTEGGNLYEFDLAKEEASPIAGGVAGVVGASENALSIYLVSTEVLGGENAEHKSPTAGKPNLYLYEAGAFTFIATLSSADATAVVSQPTPVNVEPYNHSARISPDGGALAFSSTANLTGYDNTDASSGEADAEVFRYSAPTGRLDCVSCNPSGARPAGRRINSRGFAAILPGWENQLYTPRNLADDGARLYFDSFEPLVLRDTNEQRDAYQWEQAGVGSCSKSSSDYSPRNGGCLSLISSGKSPLDSEFLDADPSGENVFLRTGTDFVPTDPGQFDIYDARVGGGLASQNPPPEEPPCEGQACQSPPPAPEAVTPSSAVFQGAGNQKVKHKKHKKKKHHKHRNAHNRRAQR